MTAVVDLGRAPTIIPARRIGRGYWASVGRRLLNDPVALAAAFVIIVVLFAAILAPWLGLADPYRGSMLRRLRPVGDALYRLGSDELGRDMLSRLMKLRVPPALPGWQ
jgi:peptide/nickel transport system permease protein